MVKEIVTVPYAADMPTRFLVAWLCPHEWLQVFQRVKAFCVLSREGLQMLTHSHVMVGTTQRVAPRPDAFQQRMR